MGQMSILTVQVRHWVRSTCVGVTLLAECSTVNSLEVAMLRHLPLLAICGAAVIAAVPLYSQAPEKPPVGPADLLPQEREIALALTAAPKSIVNDVDVYVLRRGGFVKVRSGSTGVSCLVERDHPKALYPICYDAEASRTILPSQLDVQAMRERGMSEDQIARTTTAGFETGKYKLPSKQAMSWMMSPEQDLYAGPHGEHVGQWQPHLMFYMPFLRREQLGLATASPGELIIGEEGRPTAHLVVIVKEWATPNP
jgi:hypothetical protein